MKHTYEDGSLSIEAAIEISAFSFLVFGLICVIQFIFVYAVTYNATVNTAEKVAEYSCIFFKSGLDNLSNTVRAKAINAVNTNDGDFSLFVRLADDGLDMISNEAFKGICKTVLENELEKECVIIKENPFDIELCSLEGSNFFGKGNEFTICANVRSRFLLPWMVPGEKNLSVSVKVRGNAWLYGAFSGYDVSEINVWNLDNFKRGRVVENIFGGNLPENFPTIDVFDEKSRQITMIRSIDTTLTTYQSGSNLKKFIKQEGKKLIDFKGAEDGGVSVAMTDYDTKKMLLIIPENTLISEQMNALAEVSGFLGANNVKFEIISYQRSERNV